MHEIGNKLLRPLRIRTPYDAVHCIGHASSNPVPHLRDFCERLRITQWSNDHRIALQFGSPRGRLVIIVGGANGDGVHSNNSAKHVMSLDQIVDLLGNRSRPETSWISKVAGTTAERAERAVNEVTSHSELIGELSRNIEKTGKTYYAQFPAPIDLFALVRLSRPRNLVESGVASGVSSTFLLLGIKANSGGILHSIDFPVFRKGNRGNLSWAIPQGMTSGWAVPRKLRSRWDLRQGRSEGLLRPLLEEIGTLDFYCHDSPVDIAHFEFEMKSIRKHLKPGSLVVADNTDKKVFDETALSIGAEAFYRRHSSLGAFLVP